MVLFINNFEQEQAITFKEAIAALEQGLREFALGNAIRRPRIDNFIPTSRKEEFFCFSSMEGGIKNGYYALRIKPDIISWPLINGQWRRVKYNTRRGFYGGLVFLFSVENAALLAIMNDGYIQHLRVASTSALGAKYLSRQDSRTVCIIGSGGMAHFFVPAFAAVRQVTNLRVYSPNPQHAQAFAQEMSKKLGVDAKVFDTPQEAVRNSDIIASCTNSMTPTIKGEWIPEGSYLTSVRRHEFGKDVYDRVNTIGILVRRKPIEIKCYFDQDFAVRDNAMSYAAGTEEERGRIPASPPHIEIDESKYVECINWETGQPYKRRSDSEITMLSNSSHATIYGGAGASDGIQGVQFASIGGRIYEGAVAKGLGKELSSEMFLQDIPT